MKTADEIIKESIELTQKHFKGTVSFHSTNPAESYGGVLSILYELCFRAVCFEEEMKLRNKKEE